MLTSWIREHEPWIHPLLSERDLDCKFLKHKSNCHLIKHKSNMTSFCSLIGPVPTLKGQCHEIFRFWFFSSISFPPALEYPIKTVSNFFENSPRYSQLKVDHWCR